MLHKTPQLLAGAAGLFAVGVLVFTFQNRFDNEALQGSVTGMGGSMSSSFEPEPPVGWFDPDTLQPVPDPTMGTYGGTVGGTSGGTFGGDTGGGGTTGGGAPACVMQVKEVSKSYSKPKPACTCGTNGTTLKNNFENNVKAGMNAACKDGAAGPSCPTGCSVDGGTTVSNKDGPNFVGETIDGGLAPCKKTQVRFCIQSWDWSCDMSQKCKPGGTSSSTPPSPTPNPPTTGPSSSNPLYKCCARNTPNAACTITGQSCTTGLSDGTYYTTSNCDNKCKPVQQSSSTSTTTYTCCNKNMSNAYCALSTSGCVQGDPNGTYTSFSTCQSACSPSTSSSQG